MTISRLLLTNKEDIIDNLQKVLNGHITASEVQTELNAIKKQEYQNNSDELNKSLTRKCKTKILFPES